MTDVQGTATEADVEEILDVTWRRDSAAFARGDWAAVEDDFDTDAFVGHQGGEPLGAPWRIGFPTLASYRDLWLEQSVLLRAGQADAELEAQILESSRIAGIEVVGQWALVRKEFDGWAGSADNRTRLLWRTYYFLRREGRWRITGFVGYLPY